MTLEVMNLSYGAEIEKHIIAWKVIVIMYLIYWL